MIKPEDIVSITKRPSGYGYYINFVDGKKIKVSKKRNVFPLFFLLFNQRYSYSDITKKSKKEMVKLLAHIEQIKTYSNTCNDLDGFDELRDVDKYSCIRTQILNGKRYYIIPNSNQDQLFEIEKIVYQEVVYDVSEVLEKQGGICNICKMPVGLDEAVLDYRVPKSRGGANEKDNLQALCKACYKNKRKKCMPCVCPCDKDCKLAYPEFSSVIKVLEQ